MIINKQYISICSAIIQHHQKWHGLSELTYLWFCCGGEVDHENYPDVIFEYEPETTFFKALTVMFESGQYCLWINGNFSDKSKDGELITVSAQE